ncbi:MAG: class I SAM-dependent methyltransferase [Arenicellales bacterium]
MSAHISRLIGESGGALPFDKYMEHVLYAPGLGYYAAGAVKLGPAGDFVTAPETGLLFGQCLADEVADILGHMPNAAILEFGAGSGRLAEVLIQTLAALNRLPSRYIIIELSPDLRDRQQRTLAALADKVGVPIEWRDQMPEPGVEAVVIANEVLDAFPVTRFRVEKDGVRHAGVREEEQGFSWDWSSPILSQGPEFDVARRFSLAEGYETENSPRAMAWVRMLGELLTRGVVLIIDYGYPEEEYFLPDRHKGTLRCHYRHHAHDDPFVLMGIQDITCHVNFSAVAQAARRSGFEILGYTSQEAYLLALGLLDKASHASTDDDRAQLLLASEVKRLVLPSQMGEAFKVMGLGKNWSADLNGFGLRDRSHRL